MLRNSVGVVLALLLICVPHLAGAKGGSLPPPGKWWHVPQMSQELGLTPQDKIKLDDLFVQMQQQRIHHKSTIRQAQVFIDTQFERDNLDEAALEAHFKKLAEARAQIALIQSRFLLDVRKVLGRERFQKLRHLFRQFKARQWGRPPLRRRFDQGGVK
ncbi:MAG: periplasmic heavy metal sensor [Desulfarculaceae bacterium]